MATRIALVLSGGVSLGAYQAGAVYELLWALDHRAPDAERVVLDVITGASAGAMNAAVLARAVMVDRAAAADLHHAWVTGISFARLAEGSPSASFFSDQPIWDLARAILLRPPAAGPHPAAPATLRVAFALTNLNGVRYSLGYANTPGRFDTAVFTDWIAFTVRAGAAADWPAIARAAVASGAFPFAFPTVRLERRLADYRHADIYAPEGTRAFAYTDGGLFNNEPVGLARDLVESLEDEEPAAAADRRIYLLVDPYPGAAAVEADFGDAPLPARRLADRLVNAVLGEASKRDWIRASRINTRLRWQERLLDCLAALAAEVPAPSRAVAAAHATRLAAEIATFKGARETDGALEPAEARRRHLDENLRRLGPLLARDGAAFARLREAPELAGLFLDLAYALENVAGLRNKVDLDLHLIAPAPGVLAGDFLGNFGGFFDEAWREHDYRRGRADARRVLEALAAAVPALAYAPDVPDAYVPSQDLSQVSGADVPPGAMALLARQLGRHLARAVVPPTRPRLWRALAALAARIAARRIVAALQRKQ
ncbi:MAG: patatin-like phospholipase family protein [Armatimonadota bacterium]|nr:patatin-like phospholipase family protein [Armatimonadota bacterium]MDR7485106.1 patatin-like phospholipase family protein [Armatimonadota bacterium]MDR7533494.1 patatin-like phospholipase family protein [Armatimonadota bacterium]MDR7537005.1 patatin-like phospholipase family protein [Armatimonadota bacterium]